VHESALYEWCVCMCIYVYICVYMCERLSVETVRLLGVDMCGGPVVSENGKEDVNP
jgi:hypothetical protein